MIDQPVIMPIKIQKYKDFLYHLVLKIYLIFRENTNNRPYEQDCFIYVTDILR